MPPSAQDKGRRRSCRVLSKRLVVALAVGWSALVTLSVLQGGQHISSLFAWQHVAGQQQAELISLHGSDATSASSGSRGSGSRGSGSRGSDPGPLVSRVSCKRTPSDSGNITPKESDLQQQRRCAVQQAGGSPPGGYLAVCLVVKNQHRDLPEWLDYHRRLGVSHFYVMDDSSQPPLDDLLQPYIEAGVATQRMMLTDNDAARDELHNTTCHKFEPWHRQLHAYNFCLRDYGARHQFMAFIDVDEFLVVMDGSPDLPSLLREYEGYGGLAVNWRMFGSSGHKQRQASTLLAYTKCYRKTNPENRHIKTIANMAFAARINGPHDTIYAQGYETVTATTRRAVVGPFSAKAQYSRLALHHYALKSEEDFRDKAARGDVMGDAAKDLTALWARVEQGSVEECTAGADAWRRMQGDASAAAAP